MRDHLRTQVKGPECLTMGGASRARVAAKVSTKCFWTRCPPPPENHTRQPENSKRAHLRDPALQTPPKFNEKTPRERLKERRFTSPRTAELSVHSTIVLSELLHNLLHWSLVAIPSQAPPTSAISSDSLELKHTMFCFLEDMFSTEPLNQIAYLEKLRRSLTFPANQ